MQILRRNSQLAVLASLTLLLALVLGACGDSATAVPATAGGTAAAGPLTKVKLQLRWVHQGQFAGYYVAADKGYFKEMGLDVEFIPGGPDTVPSQKVLTGAADLGIEGVASLLSN